jgi:hypothetical protein
MNILLEKVPLVSLVPCVPAFLHFFPLVPRLFLLVPASARLSPYLKEKFAGQAGIIEGQEGRKGEKRGHTGQARQKGPFLKVCSFSSDGGVIDTRGHSRTQNVLRSFARVTDTETGKQKQSDIKST